MSAEVQRRGVHEGGMVTVCLCGKVGRSNEKRSVIPGGRSVRVTTREMHGRVERRAATAECWTTSSKVMGSKRGAGASGVKTPFPCCGCDRETHQLGYRDRSLLGQVSLHHDGHSKRRDPLKNRKQNLVDLISVRQRQARKRKARNRSFLLFPERGLSLKVTTLDCLLWAIRALQAA